MDDSFITDVKSEEVKLSEKEESILKNQDTRVISEFKAQLLEKNAKKFWDLFYKRNGDRFFKDRHWTIREFKELISSTADRKTLLEVGCGAGNFIYPLLLEDTSSFFIYACDFSPRAVELVKSHQLYDEKRVKAFVADITTENALSEIASSSVDVITLIFVLSAIHPKHYDTVLRTLHDVLKPDGVILFRDYGVYDMTQLRFKPGHKISENFYMRQDGTR